ncbi:leucyl aminopeptidase family protein [Halioxenophilus aromaticivorans]|uniref:Leucyl aminopeptidase family protein n=1 Tax=Halioxenophilus aromaticivorans TaxID=1306992 RepID=A0AAV3TZE3_9ALTE
MSEVILLPTANVYIGTEGINLIVNDQKNFDQWRNLQPSHVQNWLTSTSFTGKGVALIPSPTGELSQAIFFCDTEDFFCCGDLAKMLPPGKYHCDEKNSQLLEKIVLGWYLGSYQFCAFKSNQDGNQKCQLFVQDSALLERVEKTARAVYLARDLINTPAENLMPQHLAWCAEKMAQTHTATLRQWVGEELLQDNFPTIYTVGRASEHPSRLIDLTWGDSAAPKLTLVGKGVCFDSGGLDLKPSQGMRLMKKDMGGAAHALALAELIMANQLPVRLRVLVPAVENAIGGNAFRPGDVITTRQGTTVEIDNTDAEGRLILCDALAEACTEQPELVIDFATLTGAARVALGTELPALFCTHPDVAEAVAQQGSEIDDPVWPMPLHKAYRSMLNSEVADMVNSAASPLGGAITAALFLQEFVSPDTQWMHFDVMAWNNRKLPGRPVGGEAMGLRAVYNYLAGRFEP